MTVVTFTIKVLQNLLE